MAYVSTESPTLGQGPKHFGAAPQGDGLQTLGISSAGMHHGGAVLFLGRPRPPTRHLGQGLGHH